LVITSASQAQTQRKETPIYRCGPDGRDLRDVPCPSGPAKAEAVPYDQPSHADARAARERTKAEAREAQRLEKERKEREQLQERQRLEKERKEQERKAQELKDKDKQREKERLEKERQEKDKRLAEEKKQKEAEAKRKQEAIEKANAQAAEARRQENLRRMQGLAGATGAENATGTALRDAGPSGSYGGKVAAKVKPHIVYPDAVAGNPRAEVEVRAAPDGTITSTRLVQSSGNKAWDDAVLRALQKTETLPRDVDGRVPSALVIGFRPKD
ncbi:MAG TPA: cell envelope integrity protein TolA, partial [Giesbergeria sp.]|nr:cell envelope integrity protein TolA [Giesbergeria sp.]